MTLKEARDHRVDMKLIVTGQYVEYTSLKHPVSIEMAKSLAEHLKRNSTSGRIVNVITGNVVEEF